MSRLGSWHTLPRSLTKVLGVSLAAVLLLTCRPLTGTASVNLPAVRATAVVLIDGRTGQILYSRSPHLQWPPASTTKMLTALLVVESLPDDREVIISARASRSREGRAIGLEAGERWRVGELLKVMMLHSANDASVALAEAVAGSVEAFAEMMNAKAIALGARESHFVVPHGLEDPAHYSTVFDLALIARAALQQKRIADVVRLRTWELVRPGQRTRLLVNSNRLLWRYPYADGVKTGWIPQSGHCLVASATRDGRKLIAVVLDDKRPFTDAAALLAYGFSHFRLAQVAKAGQVLATMPISNGAVPLVAKVPQDVFVAVPSEATVAQKVELANEIAPIRRASIVGRVVYTSEGEIVAAAPLVADYPVPSATLWTRLLSWIGKTFDQWS